MLGFESAPITKSLTFSTFLLSFLFGNQSDGLNLDISKVLDGEIWRPITSFLIFENIAQSFFALILFYNLSLFERQMGTRKFAAFLVFCWVVALVLSCAVIVLLATMDYHVVPSPGPYFILFAQLAFYYKYVPKLQLQQYLFLGLEFSSKSWIYLLALQLLCNQGLSSIISGLTGLVAGLVYDRDGLNLQRMRLPPVLETPFIALYRFFSYLTPRLPPAPTPPEPGQRPGREAPRGDGILMGGADRNLNPTLRNRNIRHEDPLELPPPDEESIGILVGMGFERQEVIQALRTCGNNVDAAANMLLR